MVVDLGNRCRSCARSTASRRIVAFMSIAAQRLYACADDPCDECSQVVPRRAYPAPPHGDFRRRVDILLAGLNPQLSDYRLRCRECQRVGLVRDFASGKGLPLRCRACDASFSVDDADFVRPSLEDWTTEGLNLDAKARAWINVRMALDVLDPSTNILNARICSWPSYDEKTVSIGANAGRHLLELVNETKPRVVVAYNQTAADFLRPHAGSRIEHERAFLTSGKKSGRPKRHLARWFEPHGSGFGLILGSQAQDAPSAADADGVTMRVWAATLAEKWIKAA